MSSVRNFVAFLAGLLRVLLLSGLAVATFSASGHELYLGCRLFGSDNKPREYSFAFDPEKGTLFWVEGTQNLSVFRNTSTQLWASHDAKFHDFKYDQTDFRLNRVTGAAEIIYLRKPSSDEVARCKKRQGFGCEDFLVLTEKSENGGCQLRDRAIR